MALWREKVQQMQSTPFEHHFNFYFDCLVSVASRRDNVKIRHEARRAHDSRNGPHPNS